MSEQQRYIYVKDATLSVAGYALHGSATFDAEVLAAKYPEPEYRIRVRFRNRSGRYDVVVKRRSEVKS